MFEPAEGDDSEKLDTFSAIAEAQTILNGLLAELPDEARSIVGRIERDIARIREKTRDEATAIRDAAEIQAAELEDRTENRCRSMMQHAIEQLGGMQKELFKTGELGKALATFVQIQALATRANHILPDPGNLKAFHQIGRTFYFRVAASQEGTVWGTDNYTSDSHLGSAALHSGALELGEEGVVRVTMIDMSRMTIGGSMRHGVMSHDWSTYPVGYRVVRG
jgi:LCCL domain